MLLTNIIKLLIRIVNGKTEPLVLEGEAGGVSRIGVLLRPAWGRTVHNAREIADGKTTRGVVVTGLEQSGAILKEDGATIKILPLRIAGSILESQLVHLRIAIGEQTNGVSHIAK